MKILFNGWTTNSPVLNLSARIFEISRKFNQMISSNVILQEGYQDQYLTQKRYLNSHSEIDELLSFTDLELRISDSETGRPISHALVSMDSIDRTAVCDDQGKVLIHKILSGTHPLDVIVPGYIAHSKQVHLSGKNLHRLAIKMVRNC